MKNKRGDVGFEGRRIAGFNGGNRVRIAIGDEGLREFKKPKECKIQWELQLEMRVGENSRNRSNASGVWGVSKTEIVNTSGDEGYQLK